MTDVHVVFTEHEGFGWSLTSPQAPELIGGRRHVADLLRELPEMLALGGMSGETLHLHEEKTLTSPGGLEYRVRFADEGSDERELVVGRILASIESGSEDEDADRSPRLPTGERLIIAVLETDAVGWLFDQVDEGSSASIRRYAGEDVLYGMPISNGTLEYNDAVHLAELGITRKSTILDMIDAVITLEAAGLSRPLVLA